MKSMPQRVWFLAILAMLPALLSLGCLSPELPEGSALDGPVLLRPVAKKLLGLQADELVVEAKTTVTKVPLHTQLIRQVAEKAKKAVVSVYVKTEQPYRLRLLPHRIPGTGLLVKLPGQGLGSGFLIHPSGYVITNNHVVRDASRIHVLTADGRQVGASVMARDPVFDLALLKLQGTEDNFPVLPMGDSKVVGVGDLVIAVGNPLGLGHTVTSGIISQTGRNLSGVATEQARRIRFLQTDTAINPGSSGGPLITLTGAWVGVNTAIARDGRGIGFAVPSNQVREFLDKVRKGDGEADPAGR